MRQCRVCVDCVGGWIEYCGSDQSLLSQFHLKWLMFVDMNDLHRENLVCRTFKFFNILWLVAEGLLLKSISVDSPAGHPLEACCKGSRGKGVTALDAKEAGMLKCSLLGKDLLTWPTLWDYGGGHLWFQASWLMFCAFFYTSHWVVAAYMLHVERGQRTEGCTPSLAHSLV